MKNVEISGKHAEIKKEECIPKIPTLPVVAEIIMVVDPNTLNRLYPNL